MPKLRGVDGEPLDLASDPDTEGATAAGVAISIAAKDTTCSVGFVGVDSLLVSLERSMPIEVADAVAVWADGEFQFLQERFSVILGAADSDAHVRWLVAAGKLASLVPELGAAET